jgi:NYN domain/OST-HTH/LOTUS domain
VLSTHAIMPHQNFANTVGKNASDIALVIDAMDLLHTGRFDAFCLVSSDSVFTRLAARIREQGVDVYGFGEAKTPDSFRQACKRFIYTENLGTSGKTSTLPITESEEDVQAMPSASLKQPPKAAVPLINTALGQIEDLDGWYALGAVGKRLPVLLPDFDPRTYGCSKLVTLIEKSQAFEVRRDNLVVYIKPKAEYAA